MPVGLALFFEIVRVVLSGLTLLAVVVAYKTYRANLRKQEEDRIRESDKELTAQAQASLEWAYNALTGDGAEVPPKANRLNWLTSARHLLRHEKIAARIKSETYRVVHAEHEELWRHRFYLALDHNDLLATRYWSSNEEQPWPEKIELSSALVVVRFSNWSKHAKDPTDEVDREAILNDKHALVGRAGRGLKSYALQLSQARERRSSDGS